MYVTAIVVAAGKGRRFGCAYPKPLAILHNSPLLIRSLRALAQVLEVRDIIVVADPRRQKEFSACLARYRPVKVKAIIPGGKRRQDSVLNGLKAMDPRTQLVLIHDSVRPLAAAGDIRRLIRVARKTGAAVLGVPVVSTIKEIKSPRHHVTRSPVVARTLDRSRLWEIQTPQAFKTEVISQAYRRFGGCDATDDAALVERLGRPVSIVKGSYRNIKITTPEDLVVAEALLRSGSD